MVPTCIAVPPPVAVHHWAMPLHTGSGSADGWTIVEQGSFVIGRCDACGFTSAARRARFSAETDMRDHVSLCVWQGSKGLATDGPPARATATAPPQGPAADPEVGASGRERLSAQGRS